MGYQEGSEEAPWPTCKQQNEGTTAQNEGVNAALDGFQRVEARVGSQTSSHNRVLFDSGRK